MKPTVTYNDAVCSMVAAIRSKATDVFTASTILAIMFDKEKEDTLDSIIKIQEELSATTVKRGASNPRK
jgi:hypothetical protein